MKEIRLSLKIAWYELLLGFMEVLLVAFGIWAFIDSLSIASPYAAWRFLLLFAVFALPGASILLFFRPRKGSAYKGARRQ